MIDSTTAIEVATKGPNQALLGLIMLAVVWTVAKIRDLIWS